MKTELKPYTLNARKWRIENGYTTPEWEMYYKNMEFKTFCVAMLYFLVGCILTNIAMG